MNLFLLSEGIKQICTTLAQTVLPSASSRICGDLGGGGNDSIIDFISKLVDYKEHQMCLRTLYVSWPQWSVYLKTLVREGG